MQYLTFTSFALLGVTSITAAHSPQCKAVPGTSSWPSASSWAKLNTSLSGGLIKSVPPGGVCHPGQPNYNNASCAEVATLWYTSWPFYENDPVGNAYPNWNNDSCLPSPLVPCTDNGYPVYVVNATTAEDVKAGVDFARENHVRLIVKASGHDFRGRSVAPNSLSIWTHNLKGLTWHDTFTPTGCYGNNYPNAWDGWALTRAAGEDGGSAFAFANQYGGMIHVGGAPTVNPGGYVTGGGHSVISFQKGLAADGILELTVVIPSGEIVTANACQNSDLFWGLRGGGGSTLGVIVNFTTKVWPSEPVNEVFMAFGSPTLNAEKFWEAWSYMAAEFPRLLNSGVQCTANISPANATIPNIFEGNFHGVNQTLNETLGLLLPLAEYINATYKPDVESAILSAQQWDSYYDWWILHQDHSTPIGYDIAIGSRILDEQALTSPNLGRFFSQAVGQGGLTLNFVAGPGTHAYPTDFDAVSPAWRTGYCHISK